MLAYPLIRNFFETENLFEEIAESKNHPRRVILENVLISKTEI